MNTKRERGKHVFLCSLAVPAVGVSPGGITLEWRLELIIAGTCDANVDCNRRKHRGAEIFWRENREWKDLQT